MVGIQKKRTIMYWVAAMVFFALIFGILYKKVITKQNTINNDSYKMVFFGDSIIGECRDDSSVTALLSSMMQTEVFNAAFGGSCMAYTDADKRIAYTKDCINMAGLSQAIYADDFRVQKNSRIKESATDYFDETISELADINFDSVEVVFIEQGLNDYHGALDMDNPENIYDPYTFGGALRVAVRNLKKANPNIKIYLVTPTYTWYRNEGMSCEEYNPGGGVLEDYVNKEIEIADELGIEIIDIYHDLYTHDTLEEWKVYTNDGIHPNETGRRMIADRLFHVLSQ